MTFTPEQMNKARSAKSADELLEMAKASGIAMSAEEAAKYFAALHGEGELSDSELASVAGGGKYEPQEYDVQAGSQPDCESYCRSRSDLSYPTLPTYHEMCGKCIHFVYYAGDLYADTWGKCRREFD